MIADIREALERTGTLYTNDVSDPGHLSDFWRQKIEAFCDFVETFPLDAEKQLREAQARVARFATDIDRYEETVGHLCEQLATARAEANEAENFARRSRQLIEEALPRMRSLNNAMSPGWLARAEKFLGE